jgi:hypothetical protein
VGRTGNTPDKNSTPAQETPKMRLNPHRPLDAVLGDGNHAGGVFMQAVAVH